MNYKADDIIYTYTKIADRVQYKAKVEKITPDKTIDRNEHGVIKTKNKKLKTEYYTRFRSSFLSGRCNSYKQTNSVIFTSVVHF